MFKGIMITKRPPSLYAWSKDLEASNDVRLREIPAFAMLLGWLEKFVSSRRLQAGRKACEQFWPVFAALRRGKLLKVAF